MSNQDIAKAFLNPEAYDEEVRDDIRMIQTHISWVFLAGEFAYKIKKPVNFGFLDFTTIGKRKKFCDLELELNRMLCPDMYLQVLPVTEDGGMIKINGPGRTIDYVLKMKRMPQDKLMNKLIGEGGIDKGIIDKIAKKIADFHKIAQTSDEISGYGKPDRLRFNCNENFGKTEEFIGRVISKGDFDYVKKKMFGFLDKNNAIFESRIANGKVRRIHGDMHSGNIFIVDGRPLIIDRIEFNMRFSCMDTAADVAFFAMDLDFKGKSELSSFFVDEYIGRSGDATLKKVLDFYKCYYAWVRGEVTALRLNENLEAEEIRSVEETSRKYLELALGYARRLDA